MLHMTPFGTEIPQAILKQVAQDSWYNSSITSKGNMLTLPPKQESHFVSFSIYFNVKI